MESLRCDACAKSFTGRVCFQQHEASEKHKKKVQQMSGVGFKPPEPVHSSQISPDVNNQLQCPVCMVSISGFDNYQKHVVSLEHALMVQRKSELQSQSLSDTFELNTEQNRPLPSASPFTSATNPVAAFAECKPCQKQFSGPEPYQQHLVSAGHKKKCGFTSQVMHIDQTDSMVKNEKITNNLPDDNSQSSSTTSNVSQTSISLASPPRAILAFAECKPCQKQFSGPEPYQQHLVSAGHKKKCGFTSQVMQIDQTDSMVENENITNNLLDDNSQSSSPESNVGQTTISFESPPRAIIAFAECKPCQKQFSGPEPYQQHLVSAGHKKKCGFYFNQVMQKDQTDSTVGNEKVANNLPNDPQSPYFAKCDICQLQFSGAIPYQVHLVSDSHKEKAASQSLGNSFGQSALKCDLCAMAFSGSAPYQQHLVSHGHRKKMNALNLTKQLEAAGSLSPHRPTFEDYAPSPQHLALNDQRWYCNICKTQCTGPIPYNTHINGQSHEKNARNQAIEERMRKAKESIIENHKIDSNLSDEVTSTADLQSEFKSALEESAAVDKINDLNIYVKSEDEKVLSDKFQRNGNDLLALPNLNIIPPESVDVRVFRPDDEIVFSSPKKCKEEFISEVNEAEKVCDAEKNGYENNILIVE